MPLVPSTLEVAHVYVSIHIHEVVSLVSLAGADGFIAMSSAFTFMGFGKSLLLLDRLYGVV